jgi:L-ascorbate peroxidase
MGGAVVYQTLCLWSLFYEYSVVVSKQARSFELKMEVGNTALEAVSKDDLLGAKDMIDGILKEKACGPVFVRLAWHDSGTFDVNIKEEWPKAGGAIASIRFEPEIKHGANAGLAGAVKLLEPVKEAFPKVSYADIFQMASACAIETAGGPSLGVKYGRVDAESPEQCSPEGNLPDAEAGPEGKFGGTSGTVSTEDTGAEGHLRKVFYRMGLGDEEIVALSGAHTFGELCFLVQYQATLLSFF